MVVFFDHFPFVPESHVVINVLAFFFVLSGFLIVHLYYTEKNLTTNWFRNYFVNRFARIYPVYFLLVTIAILLAHNHSLIIVLKNYTLTHALFHNQEAILIQPSWSLTVEECFYAFAPVIIYLTARYNLFIPFLISVGMTIIALFISKQNISFLHTPEFVFSTTYFGYFINFFTGAFVALLVRKKNASGTEHSKGMMWTLAGTVLTAVICGIMAYIYSKPQLNTDLLLLFNNVLLPFPIAMLYYGLVMESSYLKKVLSIKLLGFLGRTSYSFYLVHTLIIDYIAKPYLSGFIANRILLVTTTFLICTAASLILYLFYEEPLNKGIRRLFKPKKVQAAISI